MVIRKAMGLSRIYSRTSLSPMTKIKRIFLGQQVILDNRRSFDVKLF